MFARVPPFSCVGHLLCHSATSVGMSGALPPSDSRPLSERVNDSPGASLKSDGVLIVTAVVSFEAPAGAMVAEV